MHKCGRLGKSGGMIPQGNFVKIRCFEIVSEAILDKSRVVVATWIAENFRLSIYTFTKPADIKFAREKVLRLAEQEVG